MSKRYLAIDPGGKRTGLATGDDLTGIVSPAGLVETGSIDERFELLLQAIEEQGPDEIVLGMPINMDGSDSPGSVAAEELAKKLEQATGKPVHLVDERLSSFAADEVMSQSGLTHKGKKLRRDALAAMVILKDFLNSRR